MSKLFFTLAFAIGIAVVSWIGAGFIGSDLLALAFTGLIGAVYCLGFGELVNFRRQTRQLAAQVGQLPESQDQVSRWLNTLPQPLQYPAQRRIEGHAAALPGPQITPYLTGLLVMLGLLGTFAGMIVTLGGAASALDNSTELSAIRSALAAPIAVVTFVTQYVALFRLQQVAGPVYLSQIGSVAAIVGSPVAVLVLGEHLPDGFVLAALLIGLGLSIFQYRAVTRH